MNEKTETAAIEDVILRRIEGIKLKKPDMIREVIDVGPYSKFDDWPPGTRMKGEEALRSEEGALKVLDEYRYKMNDFEVKAAGDFAWASFYLSYDGVIRNRSFDVKSRVSMVLTKSGSEWRIAHEHFSMFPKAMPVSEPRVEVKKVETQETREDELEEAILKVLGDGSEKHIAEITEQVSSLLGRKVSASQVVDKCNSLVSKGVIKRTGRFYPRYKSVSTS